MNELDESKARNRALFEFQKPPPSEETELLTVWRKLTPKQQHWTLKYMRTLAQ